MVIRHHGIEHGIFTDAPFVGSRICAIGCHHGCPGCINEHLKGKPPTFQQECTEIIQEIKNHKISQGIILGGLEWTEQPSELLELCLAALMNNLQVIVYTHQSLEEFTKNFPMLIGTGIYLKCGEYKAELPSYEDNIHDVVLASNNQVIYKLNK
jgi:organic radical activating enzyme